MSSCGARPSQKRLSSGLVRRSREEAVSDDVGAMQEEGKGFDALGLAKMPEARSTFSARASGIFVNLRASSPSASSCAVPPPTSTASSLLCGTNPLDNPL